MSLSLSSFLASLDATEPPALSAPLRALWLDARGDWDGAHKCVADAEDPGSMRVHAYLHRKEGDFSNARYWYARAGVPPQDCPLEEEWRAIASALLAQR